MKSKLPSLDVVLIVAVLGILTTLFSPVPPRLLDFLILINISFAMLLLLLTFYMERPVEFSTFPSLLLIATLFRLSLNIAATRLILTNGNAGQVIGSVGAYVVGGNYIIGLVLFFILIVVQYVVITNGAQRVSEVAARFTLDSMPGQQMSIDAELNMGLIDQAEAKVRRKLLEKESGFYGAMDGASKFVKGDAIAGIIILIIDSVGGLIIGVFQAGLSWGKALQTYTLLTIGDGIVTQVPALIISLGTGIIVTRSASDARLSEAIGSQLTTFSKPFYFVGGALLLLGFLPGMPSVAIFSLSAGLVVCGLVVGTRKKDERRDSSSDRDGEHEASAESVGVSYADIRLVPLEVILGPALKTIIGESNSSLGERIAAFRKQYAQESGLVVPRVAFKLDQSMPANAYEVTIWGAMVGKGTLHTDKLLALSASTEQVDIGGIKTTEPTYGLPCVWIEESQRELARSQKYTVIDAETVFVTHLTELVKRNCAELLTRSELDRILARVRSSQPALVDELIPGCVPAGDVLKVFKRLLSEKVSIRAVELILEAMGDGSRITKDVTQLTEIVRARLGAIICQGLKGQDDKIEVLTFNREVEGILHENISEQDSTRVLVLAPSIAEKIIQSISKAAEKMIAAGLLPVLLCPPGLRPHVREITLRRIPHLRVLSYSEITSSTTLNSYMVIAL